MTDDTAHELDVAKMAQLARLDLTDAEAAELRKNFVEILDYVKLLQEVDVDGIEPTAHASHISNVMRRDESEHGLDTETALRNAPATSNDELIRVPPVIEDQEGSA